MVCKVAVLLGIALSLVKGVGLAATKDPKPLGSLKACQQKLSPSDLESQSQEPIETFLEDLKALSSATSAEIRKSYVVGAVTDNSMVEGFFSRARVPVPRGPGAITSEAILKPGAYQHTDTRSGKPWLVRVADFRGIKGVIFNTHDSSLEAREFLVFMDALRKGALKKLKGEMAGIALRIQSGAEREAKNYWVFDCRRFYKRHLAFWDAHPYRGIPEQYRDFFMAGYRQRLGLPEDQILSLRRINEVTESRSILVLQTSDGFARVTERGDIVSRLPIQHVPGQRLGRVTLDIESAISMVISNSADEPTRIELYVREKLGKSEYVLPRAPGEKTADVGNYLVTKQGVHKVGVHLVQNLATIAMGVGVDTLSILVADRAHQRLFAKHGFQVVDNFFEEPREISNPSDESEKKVVSYSVMKIRVETLLENILKKNFPEGSLESAQEDRGIFFEAALEEVGLSYLSLFYKLENVFKPWSE
ncbi:MAG: hypothetical protein AB1540_14175 [Bdellovibrionota bacterium]